jgi:cation diffusion facilitator CzcD-associated flavoprotein CzcO
MEGKVFDNVYETYDVVIIGAGISGINAAHHIQKQLPELKYVVLEGRDKIGGTWDLFRYPGIRSDTDLYSFGFSWDPWTENRAVADGESIARYLNTSAERDGILGHVEFNHQVSAANWDSETKSWLLAVDIAGARHANFRARFLILGSGYYDYKEPLAAQIPGLYDSFKGTVVHPQFWPEDLDYAGKRVVIIGSGATAITLLPNIAKRAGHVTMLQRSPTYVMSINNTTGGSLIHRLLPKSWSFKLNRLIFIWTTAMIYYASRAFPRRARSILQGKVAEQLPAHIPVDPHFQPSYRPWDQRLCFTPDGDFFESLRKGAASVETGRIVSVVGDSITLDSGKSLQADIIITATGLKLGIGAHINFTVDNQKIDLADRYAWRTALLQDVPNLAFMLGYVNASWTLGAEVSMNLVCRILKHMQTKGLTSVVPTMPSGSTITPRLIWDLESTYVQGSKNQLPRCGDRGPWRGRTNYFWDLWRAKYGRISDGLTFSR